MNECYKKYPFTFGAAMFCAKEGLHVARVGWNGKGMAVAYRPGYPEGVPADTATAAVWGLKEGDPVKIRPYLQLRCADGSYQMWLASQSDILANDWQVVDSD